MNTVIRQSNGQDITEVKLSLKGVDIAIDGFVDIDDIGVGDTALLCYTNNTNCCTNKDGEWYFPNMTQVKSKGDNRGSGDFFYRNRHKQVVRLHRYRNATETGHYYCEIPDSNSENQTLYVNIVDLSAVAISQSIDVAIAGRTFRLKCSVDINLDTLPMTTISQPYFEWFFGPSNDSIPSDVTISNITINGSTYSSLLQFKFLQESHEENYTCRFGGNGRLAAKKYIDVYPAEFSQHPINISVNRSEQVQLSCVYPLTETYVNISWSAPNQLQIALSNSTKVTSLNSSTKSELSFTADNSSYSSEYSCIAHLNYSTVTSESATLTVNYVAVGFTMSSYTVTSTGSFSLPVQVKVFGLVSRNVSVSLLYVNGEMEFVYNNTQTVTINETSPEIQNMQIPLCVSQELLNEGPLTNITVTMTIMLYSEDSLVEVSGYDSTSVTIIRAVNIVLDQLKLGKNNSITCSSILPVDVIEWLNSDDEVIASENNTNQLSLTFEPVNISIHNQQYTCRANKNGSVNKTVTLTVSDDLHVTNISATSNSIIVAWELDLTNVITSYELEYTSKIKQCEFNASHFGFAMINNSNMRNYTILNSNETPVEEDSIYNISFTAVGSNGINATAWFEVTTQEAAPTGTPLYITKTLVDDSTVSFKWKPVECAHRNGEIIGYNVTYYPEPDSEKFITVTVSEHVFTAFGLLFNTAYVFNVYAINTKYVQGPAANITLKTQSLQGILVTLQGRSYKNHGVVNLEAVKNENLVLKCHTNKTDCCNISSQREGEWFFPNGSIIKPMIIGNDLFRSRGIGVINLKWKINATIPSGIFCCMIPMPDQWSCIGVYAENEGIPVIVNISYKHITHDLKCTSSGGPATIVKWGKNGQLLIIDGINYKHTQRILFAENATYENILHIPDDSILNYNGVYECSVINPRGNSSLHYRIEAVQIVHDSLSVGDTQNITCSSIVAVDVIEWLNSDGEVIVKMNDTNQLNLTFNPVNFSVHNSQYTCRANKHGSVNTTTNLSVSVENVLLVNIDITEGTPVIGEKTTIKCTAELSIIDVMNSPILILTHPNGTNISSDFGTELSVDLDPVDTSDAGEYTCVGKIVFSELNNLSLVVQKKENIMLKLQSPVVRITYNDSLIAGSATTLTCVVEALDYTINNPNITVGITFTWLRSETVLSSDVDRVMISESSGSQPAFVSQLTLSPLSAEDTNITCSVRAQANDSSDIDYVSESNAGTDHVELNIYAPLFTVVISDGNASKITGRNYELSCLVLGTENLLSKIDYEWIKGNDTETRIGNNSINLSLSPLRLSNAGVYFCSVSINSSYLNKTFKIINMQPFVVKMQIPKPDSVKIIQPTETFFVGISFNLTCEVSIPTTVDVPITIDGLWTELSENTQIPFDIVDSPNQFKSTATFVINSTLLASQSVEYKCGARIRSDLNYILPNNEITCNTVNIHIVGHPLQPTMLKTMANSSSINISWTKNVDDIIYSYVLMYNYTIRDCHTMMDVMNVSVDGSLSNYKLSDLEENSDFTITLIASNPAGRSEPITAIAYTLQAAPSGPPRQLIYTSMDLTNITIEWDAVECSKQNGDIDGYRLTYYPTMTPNKAFIIHINDSNAKSFTIVGLQPRIHYTLRLEAVNYHSPSFSENYAQKTFITSEPEDVGLLFRGHFYVNNSIVSLLDIGEGSDALLCVTNKHKCCRKKETMKPYGEGEWLLPDTTTVLIEGSSHDFYRDRGPSVVRLNRRNNATMPTGVFHCNINDTSGVRKDIYVGIYMENNGKPVITTLTFNKSSKSFICISDGGPPTFVTWTKNNDNLTIDGIIFEEEQIILDTRNSTYRNILHSENLTNLVGTFTCSIWNTRGSDSMSISSDGLTIHSSPEILFVGSDANIICRSDLAAQKIEWLIHDNQVIEESTVANTNELVLWFQPINDSLDGKVYTCRVTRNENKVVELNFTMDVRVPQANSILNMSILSMGNSITGKSINITCTIHKTVSGLMYTPITEWTRLSQEHYNIIIDGQNTSSTTLMFNPLNTSHGKKYTCQGVLSSEALSEPYVMIIDFPLVVKISTPTVHLTIANDSDIYYAGTSLSIICNISLSSSVDSDVNVNVSWLNGSTSLSNGSDRVSISPLSGERPSFTSTLHISPLYDVDNASSFRCQASADDDSYFIGASNVREDSITIFVHQRIPSAPELKNISTTQASILLRWSQQPDDFIKGFIIIANYTGPCNDYYNITNDTVLNPSTKQINIPGLQEYSNYTIEVSAFNDAGSNVSRRVNVTTESSAPGGPPVSIESDTINLTAITISWDPVNCIQQNSIITNYEVLYTDWFINESKNLSVSALKTTTTILGLDPSTQYVFQVRAVNEDGLKSPPISQTVNTSTPKVVGFLLRNRHYGNNSVVFSEDIGEGSGALFCLTNNTECCGSNNKDGWYFPNSSLVHLTSQHKDQIGMNVSRGASVIRLHNINNNKVPTGVFKCVIPDASTVTQNLYIGIYNERKAGVVIAENLVFNREEQALYCTSSSGPLSSVTWKKDDQKLSSDSPNYVQTQNITNASSSTYVAKLFINSSDVNGSYTCIVNNLKMTSEVTQSVTVEIKGIIITGHESALPYGRPAFLNCTTDLAVETIQWLDINGNVLDNGTESFLELMIDSETSDASYTCMVQNMFGYQNKTVILRLMSKQLSTPVASSTIYVVIVVIFLTVLVLGIIIVIFLMRRKHHGKLALFSERVKRKPSSRSTRFVVHSSPLHGGLEENDGKHNNNEKLEMSTFGKSDSKIYKGEVVMIDRFGKHVEKMHEDRDKQFEIEYDSISKEPQNSHAIADIVVNRLKNRFANIFPYDHCRVKLKKVAGDENSDYINASYMDGYEKPNAYIAAQGPLPNTLEDFWKMIWENRLTTVVMLTQCFEGRKKCECYWPENINCTFEPGQGIEVILTSMTPFSEYTVRNMTVTKSSEPELAPLNVVQFHFLAWPDHGVPNNCAVMLNFVRRVRKLHPYSNPCPLLVHCSAGVGRTGTFIVLDSMLERMKTEDTLNVYEFVKKLRTQRVLMVQTQAQYIFIHDALKEVIMCGQTEIPAADIRSIIGQLNLQYSPYSPLTGFEHQLQVLNQLKYVSEEDCFSSASSEQNMRKNRYSNKLPNNFNRVQLKSTASPGSDYINASFIDGYRQRRTYIATQGPLDSTVCDFWRMVWEKESKCVVLLTKLQEQGEEMCCCYWPTHEGEAKSYGHITVKLLLEEHYGDCNLRKFEINEDKTGVVGVKTAFTVTQFHFMVWPEHETPPITSSLIELIGNVNKVQRGSGGRPMIVMCNDGVGRTGTFICIHAQLERLKTEGVFDFFQFIKSARMQRPGLITDSTQYALCHEVLADYLDSFDTYANFKEVM